MSKVDFLENNQISTTSHIQKFSLHVTMNEFSINNGFKIDPKFDIPRSKEKQGKGKLKK